MLTACQQASIDLKLRRVYSPLGIRKNWQINWQPLFSGVSKPRRALLSGATKKNRSRYPKKENIEGIIPDCQRSNHSQLGLWAPGSNANVLSAQTGNAKNESQETGSEEGLDLFH
jgi:hypothetical protein